MLPEEQARVKIDKQLTDAGWEIVDRDDYNPINSSAVREALMQGNKESDYLLFVDNKAIAVVEAKKESNNLGNEVASQAENYSVTPESWVGLWFENKIPLVYLANGNKLLFKNMLLPDSEYEEIREMHSPKKMLQLIGAKSEYGALPRIEKKGLRDCQYNAEIEIEKSFKNGKKKALSILATGSGKTYLACLASYRLLNYTQTKRVLFLVDRNNLARQTETEFSLFNRTENQKALNDLYLINRLKKKEDINGDIVISTIQKLFAVLTGQDIPDDDDEDKEDETSFESKEKDAENVIQLGDNLLLSPDHFQFIVVDECHRSIYGKWKAVLEYFSGARILGLTATPTPEAYAFFDNNIVENYTYEKSVVDGVNVPARIYRITTEKTTHGGVIDIGETIQEKSKKTNEVKSYAAKERIDYTPTQLDRSVINHSQIETVLTSFRDSIYNDLYPDREEDWRYIPKTLIFAKDDNHASEIVESVKKVFAEKFPDNMVPEKFVQKITYSAGDSNALIRDLRMEKEFRIAVTVTLVATGTDVRPLEIVLFMKDVHSSVLYTQMKGRGCRVINGDKLKEVTPNAINKDCFYIVDAVGVTESYKDVPKPGPGGKGGQKTYTLEQLLEHLAHGELSDENLGLLRDCCSTIQRRYENNAIFGRHLDMFKNDFGFEPRTLADSINSALESNALPEFVDPSHDNRERFSLISCLITDINARKKLLEMQRGYYAITNKDDDELIYAGFSKESAKDFIETFEEYINTHKDSIEALRILYNSEDTLITHSMLIDLRDRLLAQDRQFTADYIWSSYKVLDSGESVDEFNAKENAAVLTDLIQIVRFAFKINSKLVRLQSLFNTRFNLYCGQKQRNLTENQIAVMRQIADYIASEGAITVNELNSVDADLWRKGIMNFGKETFEAETVLLSKFLLRVA
ncbi:MAG: DEAD/DEAH box helicase family protein [Clostridia bacterium]|nr:DEAD/DEAH box helicase family protein [Clostridia bacterium]